MAACTHRVATASTVDAASYASGAFTPAAGDLLVVFVVHSATTPAGAPTVTDSQSLGFTLIDGRLVSGGGAEVYSFIANNFAAASSMTVTFNCAGSTTPTGAIIFVVSVSGMSLKGAAAKRGAGNAVGIAATTPAPALPAAALTTNPVLGLVGNKTNPATLTPPTSWTEQSDTGYATPTTGGEYVTRDSGFTGTTVTWGSTSASVHGDLIMELDATAPTLPRSRRYLQAVNRAGTY